MSAIQLSYKALFYSDAGIYTRKIVYVVVCQCGIWLQRFQLFHEIRKGREDEEDDKSEYPDYDMFSILIAV